jgi:hypothetical protein
LFKQIAIEPIIEKRRVKPITKNKNTFVVNRFKKIAVSVPVFHIILKNKLLSLLYLRYSKEIKSIEEQNILLKKYINILNFRNKIKYIK